MYLMLIMLLFLMFIIIIMMLFNFMIMKNKMFDREKLTPFECGFNPLTMPHLPFSINFFLISMIFLIFDIEIVLLLPIILTMDNMNKTWILTIIYMLLILMLGIYYEWLDNSINWVF